MVNLQPASTSPERAADKQDHPFQQINLRGFTGAVEAFDGDEPARKIGFRKCFHDARRAWLLNLVIFSHATSPR